MYRQSGSRYQPVELDSIVLLVAVLKLNGEVESNSNLVCWVAQTDVDLPSTVDDGRAMRDKLQSVLKELWLHVWHVFKFLQGHTPESRKH
jgi:hypothetical protein